MGDKSPIPVIFFFGPNYAFTGAVTPKPSKNSKPTFPSPPSLELSKKTQRFNGRAAKDIFGSVYVVKMPRYYHAGTTARMGRMSAIAARSGYTGPSVCGSGTKARKKMTEKGKKRGLSENFTYRTAPFKEKNGQDTF